MKQLGSFFLTLWIIVTLTFILMHVIPGDPFTDEQALPPEIHAKLLSHYGLDQPWHTQYLNYIKSILTWDLGPSFKYKDRTVNQIINEGFPISLILGAEALALALSLGITLGTIGALKQSRWQDHLCMIIATLGISIPSFTIATLLQYTFAVKLELLPVARWGTFVQTILPAISLAALPIAFIARLTRTNMVEVLKKDYITVARAKGISEWNLIIHHALRNALLPLLPYLGQLIANILVGSFVIEKIFGIPGLGKWFVISVINRDYTVIMGTTLFYGIIMLSTIYLCDVFYRKLDPRTVK